MAGPVGAHARKFGAAYFALAVILGAAIGTFIVLVERPAPLPPPPWSAWRPLSPDPVDRTQEIADHVAAQYSLPSGHRLVRVFLGDPDAASASQPIQAVAVAKKANPTAANDFDVVRGNETVMYSLCGTGAKCAIREGKPSVARAAVLRREALELALYTFEYVEDASSVVAFFPPKLGANPTFALFFARSDLKSELKHPLRRTLPQAKPSKHDRLSAVERGIVDELTTPRIFRFAMQRSTSGQRVLVLLPQSPA